MSCEKDNFVLELDLVRASGDGMTDRRPEQIVEALPHAVADSFVMNRGEASTIGMQGVIFNVEQDVRVQGIAGSTDVTRTDARE